MGPLVRSSRRLLRLYRALNSLRFRLVRIDGSLHDQKVLRQRVLYLFMLVSKWVMPINNGFFFKRGRTLLNTLTIDFNVRILGPNSSIQSIIFLRLNTLIIRQRAINFRVMGPRPINTTHTNLNRRRRHYKRTYMKPRRTKKRKGSHPRLIIFGRFFSSTLIHLTKARRGTIQRSTNTTSTNFRRPRRRHGRRGLHLFNINSNLRIIVSTLNVRDTLRQQIHGTGDMLTTGKVLLQRTILMISLQIHSKIRRRIRNQGTRRNTIRIGTDRRQTDGVLPLLQNRTILMINTRMLYAKRRGTHHTTNKITSRIIQHKLRRLRRRITSIFKHTRLTIPPYNYRFTRRVLMRITLRVGINGIINMGVLRPDSSLLRRLQHKGRRRNVIRMPHGDNITLIQTNKIIYGLRRFTIHVGVQRATVLRLFSNQRRPLLRNRRGFTKVFVLGTTPPRELSYFTNQGSIFRLFTYRILGVFNNGFFLIR